MKLSTKEENSRRRRNAIKKRRKQKQKNAFYIMRKELARIFLEMLLLLCLVVILGTVMLKAQEDTTLTTVEALTEESTSTVETSTEETTSTVETSTEETTSTVETSTEEITSTVETSTEEITSTIDASTEEITSINQEDLELLAHLIYGEAGDQNDRCQRAVGSVVMNRIAHRRYPNNLKGVIFQKGQYACTWDGNFDKKPSKRAYENARWVLQGNNIFPKKVIYQSQFKQGDGIYEVIGTEMFCYEN